MNDSRNQNSATVLTTQNTFGQLTVFLGASPGVGKTWAMLNAARDLQQQGVRVLAGQVEAHGRPEVETLMSGFEVLPRGEVSYHNHNLYEFDLDKALHKRPDVILIDEPAYSYILI